MNEVMIDFFIVLAIKDKKKQTKGSGVLLVSSLI